MEFLLQWLDELDDLVFAGLLMRERLSRSCLAIGLIAALFLRGAPWEISLALTFALVNVSAASVIAWSVVSVVGTRLDRRVARSSSAA